MRQNQRLRLQIASENLDPKLAYVPAKNGKLVPKNSKHLHVAGKVEETVDPLHEEKNFDLLTDESNIVETSTLVDESPSSESKTEDSSVTEEKPKKKSPFPPKKKKKSETIL